MPNHGSTMEDGRWTPEEVTIRTVRVWGSKGPVFLCWTDKSSGKEENEEARTYCASVLGWISGWSLGASSLVLCSDPSWEQRTTLVKRKTAPKHQAISLWKYLRTSRQLQRQRQHQWYRSMQRKGPTVSLSGVSFSHLASPFHSIPALQLHPHQRGQSTQPLSLLSNLPKP